MSAPCDSNLASAPRGGRPFAGPFLLAGLALLGLAASLAANSPVHPRSVAKASAPRRVATQQATRAVVEPVDVDDPAARCRALAEELRGLLAAEWIGDLPAHGEARLQEFLVDLLLDGGFPEEALATLRRLDASADLCRQAGWRLQNGEELALAAQAFRMAVQRAPDCRWTFQQLEEVDPAAALEAFDAGPSWSAKLSADDVQATRARLLARAGRRAEAVGVLRAALELPELDQRYWNAFLELAPEMAAEELTAYVERNPSERLCRLLSDHLSAEGDPRRATALLFRLVLTAERPGGAAEHLSRLDLDQARAAIEARLGRDPACADGWSALGELEWNAGRTGRALEVWQRAFELDPANCDWTGELLVFAPERLTGRCLEALQGCEDDEDWGDVGDLLWRAGQTAAAREAWSTAAALDPEDEDWSERLTRASAGLDPL